ncbi:MAG: hypothetical protein K2H19_00935 [Ruminococcus sp.]|nr:hypothetical protein [Ruminococcus sp.]
MLEMIKGCTVPDAEKLSEQYKTEEYWIRANVNASKIEEIFQHFISIQTERIFFILELPTSREDEERLRKSNFDPMHKDIYYIDGLFNEQALLLLIRYGELLINDGLCQFGFGSHDGSAEIMLEKYNIMTIWAKDTKQYRNFFDAHDIHITDNYICAWDTFSIENGGECRTIKINGISIYDLPNELKEWGIYLAETREDT